MRNFVLMGAITAFLALGLWLLNAEQSLLSRSTVGFMLFIGGGVVGLRIGFDSALKLLRDLTRLNKFLAEQNADLVERNHCLLKRLVRSSDPID